MGGSVAVIPIYNNSHRGVSLQDCERIYIPEPGAFWACNDFSQQEPRWTTHFASIMKLPKAEEAAHEYRTNPKVDNHDMMAKLTGLDRKPAKAIFLGLCYGEGEPNSVIRWGYRHDGPYHLGTTRIVKPCTSRRRPKPERRRETSPRGGKSSS